MKLLLPIFIFAIAAVHAGLQPNQKPYMFWPGDDGKPRLAILHRGLKTETLFDPELVTFNLYTKDNPDVAVQMFVGKMNGAPFDPSKKTKFIIHGFTSNAMADWIVEMRYTYLDAGDYNVVAVDWERPAEAPNYFQAKDNAEFTGRYLGDLMAYVRSQGGDPMTFHCIGHSLGAHVCGFAGKQLLLSSLTLGRISGLDPALPLYDYKNLHDRLYRTDAAFVDVVHTCGGKLAFWLPIGHVDFYPNNGESSQPGCGIDILGSCSHHRAHEYFHESINSLNFRSLFCLNVGDFRDGDCGYHEEIPLGEQVPTTATYGTYYLRTNGQPPFAMG